MYKELLPKIIKVLAFVILAYLHVSVQNRYEKNIVQILFGSNASTRRPSCADKHPLKTSCYGMPSGHSEFAVLFFGGLHNLLNPFVCLLLILSVGLQRIAFKRHTVLQVLIGYAIGLAYLIAYSASFTIHAALPFVILAISVLSLTTISILILSSKQRSKLPDWVHPSLTEIIVAKQDKTSFSAKLIQYMGHVSINSDIGFLTWKDLEMGLDELCSKVKERPDVVIGIKTGGAILAGYVSNKFKVPCDFIKTKRAIYNCTTKPQKSIDILKDVLNVEAKETEAYQVCEMPKFSVKGKKILLVDEVSYSGGTIKKARDFLLELGAASVETMAFSSFTRAEDYWLCRGVTAWPWSFDT